MLSMSSGKVVIGIVRPHPDCRSIKWVNGVDEYAVRRAPLPKEDHGYSSIDKSEN